jgi:uncharacterized protein (TIGR02217 family)
VSFLESPRFPEKISFHALGGPGFQTDIVVVESGAEYRNQNWSQSRRRYEVSHAARRPEAYNTLKAFFHAVSGMATGFRFKDWTDFEATASEGIFVQIDSTHFQMYKRYTAGSINHDRIIQKPITTAVITGGVTPVVDYTTGIVAVASGTPLTWATEFDTPCRFETDVMRGQILDRSPAHGLIMAWESIPIVEIRV